MTNYRNAILITGANGGIGQALCKEFAAADYYVIGTDKGKQECVCDHYLKADLGMLVNEESSRLLFFDELRQLLKDKKLKGIINNAATQILDHIDDLKVEDFQESMDVNVVAPMLLIKELIYELEQAAGSVVNIGSIHSKLTKPGFISYASSKSALTGLSQSLAVDLGKRVRINVIQPAATETEMLSDGFKDNTGGLNSLKNYHPMMRLARPAEIAYAALFLVSENSGFITGSTLNVDGGIGCRLHDPE